MNLLTRLYRHFFPIPESSCLVKGLVKAMTEQGTYIGCLSNTSLPFKVGDISVEIDYDLFHESQCVTFDRTSIILSGSDRRSLTRAMKGLRKAWMQRENERIAALQAPVIAAIEKVGCP